MNWMDLLRMSSSNLRRRKLRTFLTVLGVVIGTASIVVMISLGLGMQQSMYRQIEQAGGMTAITVLLIAFVATAGTAVQQVKPIRDMAAAARRFAEGNFDARVHDTGRDDEVGELTAAFNAMADSLQKTEQQRREFIANIFFYTKGDTTLMIDAGYNYPRLKEKMGWLDIDPVKIKHILITHQDTDHVGAVETDSDGLFRTAKLYIGAVENRYLTGEVRRKVIFGLYKLPMESWSPGIVKVTEKDYADGYLKGGYRKTPITRLFNWIMRTFHMSFMIHLEFRG